MNYMSVHTVVEGIFPCVLFVSKLFCAVTLSCAEEMNF